MNLLLIDGPGGVAAQEDDSPCGAIADAPRPTQFDGTMDSINESVGGREDAQEG